MPSGLTGSQDKFKKEKSDQKSVSVSSIKVIQTTLEKRIYLTGQSRFKYKIPLISKNSGEVLSVSKFEGEKVKKGDVILKTDDKYLLIQKKGLELQCDKTNTTLKKQRMIYEMKKKQYQNNLQISDYEVDLRKQGLLKLNRGARSEELVEMEENLKKADALYGNAKKNFTRINNLYKKKSVSSQAFDEANSQLISAKSQYFATKARNNLLKKGSRVEDKKTGKISLDISKIKLSNLKLDEENLKAMEFDIEGLELSVKEFENRISEVDEKIKDTLLKAPFDGVLSDRAVGPGEMVSPQKSLFILASVDQCELEFVVGEKSFAKLSTGMSVDVFFPYRGIKIKCKLNRLIPHKDRETGRYTAFSDFKSSQGILLSEGEFCRADVIIDKKDNVLVLPKKIIVYNDDQHYVYRLVAKKNDSVNYVAEKVKIKLGFSNDDFVEVMPGSLNEGDQIVNEGKDVLLGGETVMLISGKAKE